MRLKEATIYLKQPRTIDLAVEHPVLVHEAAHAKHFYDDRELSKIWYEKFRIDRTSGWNDDGLARRNGLVDKRAAIDYTKDIIQVNFPEGEADFHEIGDGVVIRVFGSDLNNQAMADDFLEELRTVPRVLRGYVRNVVLCPDLIVNGAHVTSEKISSLFPVVAEDIAYHVGSFYAVSTFKNKPLPDSMKGILQLIDQNPKTRARLEFLLDSNFLDHSQSSWLLDSNERGKALLVPKSELKTPELRAVKLPNDFDGGWMIPG
jgi:hypothetical protein